MTIEKLTGLFDPRDVSRMTGITPAHVRLIRHRTGQPQGVKVGQTTLISGLQVIALMIGQLTPINPTSKDAK